MREKVLQIWHAGLEAVLAEPLMVSAIEIDGDFLIIDTESFDQNDFDRVIVVGAGKAAGSMAAGLELRLRQWWPETKPPIEGFVNVPAGGEREIPGVTTHVARPAGVNEPTLAGVAGSQEILRRVKAATPRDLVIAIISGGGSALLPLPIHAITLDDKTKVIRKLSGAGATINELNAVRKRLSQIKGGGLLRQCHAGMMLTLVLSDVLGDPLDVIASGPTVLETSTVAEATAILQKYDPQHELPACVYRAIQQERSDDHPIACQATTVIIGNNAVAVDAAGIQAEAMGLNHIMQSAQQSEGSAETIGRRIADMMVDWLRTPSAERQHDCLIWGGEPTVRLAETASRGKGGRNQQLVLAAYERLLQHQLSASQWQRMVILSAGTDGEDGPTDAAGALLDGQVHQRATDQGLSAGDFLSRNDAYHFFAQTGGLILTGPTGTNVCDVRVAVVR